jgi:hypothetical protein
MFFSFAGNLYKSEDEEQIDEGEIKHVYCCQYNCWPWWERACPARIQTRTAEYGTVSGVPRSGDLDRTRWLDAGYFPLDFA